MKGNPTTLVVASDAIFNMVRIQRMLRNSQTVRMFTSDNPVGVQVSASLFDLASFPFSSQPTLVILTDSSVKCAIQLGGALKNPLAVGAGMVTALGFGTNTLSAMVTRASNELRQLCVAMGGNPRTIDGLAGMGDLMLTCFSSQSCNERCRQRLMRGETVEDVQKNCTVEGIATADVAIEYADMCGLELPMLRCVHLLIHKKITSEEAVLDLMGCGNRKKAKVHL
jgi:glycerol-3-phosphate dehydrogenase (NAD+)